MSELSAKFARPGKPNRRVAYYFSISLIYHSVFNHYDIVSGADLREAVRKINLASDQ